MRVPAFTRLAISNLTAQSAEQIALAAAPIVAVMALDAGEGEVGILQFAVTLPFLLFAIPAGLVVDRLSRRVLMAVAEAVRAAALLAVLVLAQTESLSWPLLAGLGFIAACGTVMFSVATPALVPALVTPGRLPKANAQIELGRTTAYAAGPALGGAFVGWVGAGPAFGLAAGLSLIAVALLARLYEPPRTRLPPRHPWREIVDGIAFVTAHRMLRPVLLTQLVFNTSFFVIFAVFVPYAVRHIGLSASAVGGILAVYGAGMVLGAAFAPAVLRRLPFGVVVGIGPVSGLLAAIAMAATIWLPSPALAAVSFFLFGSGPLLWVVSTTTLRQAVTPAALLGRVSALNILAYGARPVGAALGAGIGTLYGAEACLLVAVPGFAVQAVIIWASPIVRLPRQPECTVPSPAIENGTPTAAITPRAAG